MLYLHPVAAQVYGRAAVKPGRRLSEQPAQPVARGAPVVVCSGHRCPSRPALCTLHSPCFHIYGGGGRAYE